MIFLFIGSFLQAPFSIMFSLFALFHTGKTRLHTDYNSARPFPASDLISLDYQAKDER
jgi:hypothetical protein